MVEEEKKKVRLETVLFAGFVTTLLLSFILIVIASIGNETVYSAYVTDASSEELQYQQLNLMADDLDSQTHVTPKEGYQVYNTLSTPMLVNDWREPHRTLLTIIAPEKPIDQIEAEAIYDFVTQKGGKVIIASNGSNAQIVADQFGVKYQNAEFGLIDDRNYYSTKNLETNELYPDNQRNIWSMATINSDIDEDVARRGCSSAELELPDVDNCAMPVMFSKPTAMQLLGPGKGESSDPSDENYVYREVSFLSNAQPGAFLDDQGTQSLTGNVILGSKENKLIIRVDYPEVIALDKKSGENNALSEVNVTGSIVFVSGHAAFSNHLWDLDEAKKTGKDSYCLHVGVDDANPVQNCWKTEITTGDDEWLGNSRYFEALVYDMMEFDNDVISNLVRKNPDRFYVVFDESRHATGVLTEPFSETMSTIVLLTSDTWLKWLIVLNMLALLAIAIMVVPEKDNWRHIFDLTRFRERPSKIDPSKYQQRVREALMAKVRLFHDLTRDEMAVKSPGEIQTMISEPRLIELAYSQNRTYSPQELRQLMQTIRRWGK